MRVRSDLTGENRRPTGMLGSRDAKDERSRQLPWSRNTLVPSGGILFSQGEQKRWVVELVDGVVRAVHLSENGNREVLGFFWSGAVISPSRETGCCFSAEAVTLCRIHHRALASPLGEHHACCGAEHLLQELLPLLSAIRKKNSIARLAWFLLRIRDHLPYDRRRAAHRLVLPRADVADYLGMSVATVSRTLADFNRRALVALPSRRTIRFLDVPSMSRLAQK